MSVFTADGARKYVDVIQQKSEKYKILFQATIDIPASFCTEASKTIYVFNDGAVIEHLYEHDDIEGHCTTDNFYRLLK